MDGLDAIVEKARQRARFRVAALRLEHPGQDEVALGRRLVASMAVRAGFAGAATGALSLVALPLGLPAGIAVSLLLEAELIFALLEVYEMETEGEQGRIKLYALWAGAGFADAAKSVGMRAGATPSAGCSAARFRPGSSARSIRAGPGNPPPPRPGLAAPRREVLAGARRTDRVRARSRRAALPGERRRSRRWTTPRGARSGSASRAASPPRDPPPRGSEVKLHVPDWDALRCPDSVRWTGTPSRNEPGRARSRSVVADQLVPGTVLDSRSGTSPHRPPRQLVPEQVGQGKPRRRVRVPGSRARRRPSASLPAGRCR